MVKMSATKSTRLCEFLHFNHKTNVICCFDIRQEEDIIEVYGKIRRKSLRGKNFKNQALKVLIQNWFFKIPIKDQDKRCYQNYR
jgi:hypothetical protein